MRIYFIRYRDDQDAPRVEAFKSKTLAQKRVADLTKQAKAIKKLWESYVINRKNKPTVKPIELPDGIREAEFDISGEGLLQAFVHLENIRGSLNGNNR